MFQVFIAYIGMGAYYMDMRAKTVSLRIPAELAERLRKVTDRVKKPYAPTATAILLRGLELALKEIEKK